MKNKFLLLILSLIVLLMFTGVGRRVETDNLSYSMI